MKDHKPFKVKLLRTVKNGFGDVFRKNSIVTAEKMYGGFRLIKSKRKKDGCLACVTKVQISSFEIIDKSIKQKYK